MNECLARINDLKNKFCGAPVSKQQIIRIQQELKLNRLPAIPEDYVEFLHHYNIVSHNSGTLWGINPNGYAGDLLSENLNLELPSADILILGCDEFDFLAYNSAKNVYQILDRDDFVVLQTYQRLDTAINYILKLGE